MLNLIPTPKKCTVVSEELHPVCPMTVTSEMAWRGAARAFCDSVSKIYEVNMATANGCAVLLDLDASLPEGAYVLDSTGEDVVIRAATVEGAQYGIATLLQLLEKQGAGIGVPSVVIEDHPDKEYRAFMIATGRIFHPVKKMLKYIDLCYFYKVKYLHWHLADSLLYSVPSKAFPKICQQGKCYSF